jgi:hypothetical protein
LGASQIVRGYDALIYELVPSGSAPEDHILHGGADISSLFRTAHKFIAHRRETLLRDLAARTAGLRIAVSAVPGFSTLPSLCPVEESRYSEHS